MPSPPRQALRHRQADPSRGQRLLSWGMGTRPRARAAAGARGCGQPLTPAGAGGRRALRKGLVDERQEGCLRRGLARRGARGGGAARDVGRFVVQGRVPCRCVPWQGRDAVRDKGRVRRRLGVREAARARDTHPRRRHGERGVLVRGPAAWGGAPRGGGRVQGAWRPRCFALLRQPAGVPALPPSAQACTSPAGPLAAPCATSTRQPSRPRMRRKLLGACPCSHPHPRPRPHLRCHTGVAVGRFASPAACEAHRHHGDGPGPLQRPLARCRRRPWRPQLLSLALARFAVRGA